MECLNIGNRLINKLICYCVESNLFLLYIFMEIIEVYNYNVKVRKTPKIRKRYIEDIYFFEVNTKYISSSVLKTSEFSLVRSTNENFNVFNSRDEMYLVFTKKASFLFILYFLEDLQLINLLTMLQAESQ